MPMFSKERNLSKLVIPLLSRHSDEFTLNLTGDTVIVDIHTPFPTNTAPIITTVE